MNYHRLYSSIIERARSSGRSKTDGACYERHHIIPKSMGGNNTKENLVLLTMKEHYVAHHLLWRMHRNSSMALALLRMKHGQQGQYQHKVTAREYEAVKKIALNRLSLLAPIAGSISGKNAVMQNRGVHGFDSKKLSELGKKSGKLAAQKKIGAMAIPIEQRIEALSRGRITQLNSGHLRELAKASNDKRKAKAEKDFEDSLEAAGFDRKYRINKEEAKLYGIKYYFDPVYCSKHPELLGKKRTKNPMCTGCAKPKRKTNENIVSR